MNAVTHISHRDLDQLEADIISLSTTEEHLLDFALNATAAQVDQHCRELRNV